eukprot:TRINITY_DN6405_c0_g1_i1.p1 TRINITY_DN6405_c0_g1~~TRINITY_DN6405_c0_g1_i1.p1  ORF type:complete len:1317 (-),score=464.16 TRINITY_DN6405_c0_g1_i1:56-4006(-)
MLSRRNSVQSQAAASENMPKSPVSKALHTSALSGIRSPLSPVSLNIAKHEEGTIVSPACSFVSSIADSQHSANVSPTSFASAGNERKITASPVDDLQKMYDSFGIDEDIATAMVDHHFPPETIEFDAFLEKMMGGNVSMVSSSAASSDGTTTAGGSDNNDAPRLPEHIERQYLLLKCSFQEVDRQQSGCCSMQDLIHVMKSAAIEMSHQQAEMMQEQYAAPNGAIDYRQFMNNFNKQMGEQSTMLSSCLNDTYGTVATYETVDAPTGKTPTAALPSPYRDSPMRFNDSSIAASDVEQQERLIMRLRHQLTELHCGHDELQKQHVLMRSNSERAIKELQQRLESATQLNQATSNDVEQLQQRVNEFTALEKQYKHSVASVDGANAERLNQEQQAAHLLEANTELLAENAKLSTQLTTMRSMKQRSEHAEAELKTVMADMELLRADLMNTREQRQQELRESTQQTAYLQRQITELTQERDELSAQHGANALNTSDNSLTREYNRSVADQVEQALTAKVKELQGQLEAASTATEFALHAATSEFSETVQTFKAEIANLKQQLANRTCECEALTAELSAKTAAFEEQTGALNAENATIKEQVQAATTDLFQQRTEMIARTDALQQEAALWSSEKEALEAQLAAFNASTADQHGVIDDLQAQIGALTTDVARSNAAAQAQANKVTLFKRRMDEQTASHTSALAAANEASAVLQAQLLTCERELAEVNSKLQEVTAAAEQQLAESQTKLVALQAELSAAQTAFEGKSAEAAEFTGKFETVQKVNADQVTRIDSLVTQVDCLIAASEAAKSDSDKTAAELVASAQKCASLAAAGQELDQQLRAVTATVECLTREQSDLTAELSEARNQLSASQAARKASVDEKASMQDVLNKFKERVATQSKSIQELNESNEKLFQAQAQLREQASAVEPLKSQLRTCETERSEWQSKYNNAHANIMALDVKFAETTSELVASEKQIAELESSVKAYVAKLDESARSLATAEQNSVLSKDREALLTEQLVAAQKQVETMEQTIALIQSETSVERQQLNASALALQKQVVDLVAGNNVLQATSKDQQTTISALQQNLSERKTEVAQLTTEVEKQDVALQQGRTMYSRVVKETNSKVRGLEADLAKEKASVEAIMDRLQEQQANFEASLAEQQERTATVERQLVEARNDAQQNLTAVLLREQNASLHQEVIRMAARLGVRGGDAALAGSDAAEQVKILRRELEAVKEELCNSEFAARSERMQMASEMQKMHEIAETRIQQMKEKNQLKIESLVLLANKLIEESVVQKTQLNEAHSIVHYFQRMRTQIAAQQRKSI